MGTWDISTARNMYPGSEEETIRRLAEGGNCARIYKLANDYGDKVTHTNYYLCADSSEELALFRSPLIHNVVLVYDRGMVVSQQVTFRDSPEGRRVLGIELLDSITSGRQCGGSTRELNDKLCSAAADGDTALVKKLLGQGADPNAITPNGYPALVCGGRSFEIVELLLKAGADPNVANEENDETPLSIAAGEGRLRIADLLVDHGAGVDFMGKKHMTALMLAVRSAEGVRFLLEKGANQTGRYGSRALGEAAFGGHLESVRVLLESGVDPNLGKETQSTALDNARRSRFDANKDEIIRILISYGAQ